MKKYVLATLVLCAASVVVAGMFTHVLDDGDGTVSIRHSKSFNSALPLRPNELARLPFAYQLPACKPRYYAWDGQNVAEASQLIKDAVDAAAAVTEDAVKDALADPEQMGRQRKAIVEFLCLWINDCVPVEKKKTAAEIRAGIRSHL